MCKAKPIIPLHLVAAVAVFLAAFRPTTGQSSPPAPTPPRTTAGPAPSPALDCFAYLMNLSDCLTFVEGGSNLSKPDPGCCPELTTLVNKQPICLCELLGNPAQVGISVDMKRALQLPSVCNVTTPPVTLCAAVGVPVALPAPSEAPSAGGEGTVAAANPSSADENNGGTGTSILASNPHFIIGLSAIFGLLVSF